MGIRYRTGDSVVTLSEEQWDEVGKLIATGMTMRAAVARILCWKE